MRVASPRRRVVGFACIVASAVGFGFMPIFAQLGYADGLTNTTLLFGRFLLATLLLAPLAWRQQRRSGRPVTRRAVLGAFGLGLVIYTTQASVFFAAVSYLGALATVVLYLFPAVVAVTECALWRIRPRAALVAALLVSLVGVGLTVGPLGDRLHPVGLALGVGSALLYVVYILLSDRMLTELPALPTATLLSAGCAVSLGIGGLATGELRLQVQGWWWIVGLTLCASVVGVLFFFLGLERVGPTPASIGSTLEPVTSLGASALILAAPASALQWVGAALVIGAAIVGILNAPGPKPAPLPAGSDAEGA